MGDVRYGRDIEAVAGQGLCWHVLALNAGIAVTQTGSWILTPVADLKKDLAVSHHVDGCHTSVAWEEDPQHRSCLHQIGL